MLLITCAGKGSYGDEVGASSGDNYTANSWLRSGAGKGHKGGDDGNELHDLDGI
jgi:hypothetical protein